MSIDLMEATTAMSDTPIRKYLFDLAFDGEIGSAEREKPKPTYSQEQLDAARQEAYESGFNAGQKAMMEDQQQYMNVLLTQIEQNIAHLIQSSIAEWQRQLTQLQEIALVIARKIMPTYIERNGLAEIETIINKVVAEMGREPRLVIRVSDAQFDAASARINSIVESQAFSGKVVILGEADMGPSDCRVEWADGGIERDTKTLWQDIDRIMNEALTFESTMMQTPPPTACPLPSSAEATTTTPTDGTLPERDPGEPT